MGVQITQFVPGVMSGEVYPSMPYEEKLVFLRKLARAFDALWRLHPPGPRLIGELKATMEDGRVSLRVGPDRHYSLGGPFTVVADFLRAHIRGALSGFEKAQGIDEYKERYLVPVRDFVKIGMLNIPEVAETIRVVPPSFGYGIA